MGTRRRLSTVAFLAAGIFACIGGTSCKPKQETRATSKPPDHLAPDEVAEGKERAFGLPLPQLSRVHARFEKTVHVVSPLPLEDLEKFVRGRVKDGTITTGTGSLTMANVVPAAAPQTRVNVEIRVASPRATAGTRSELVVTDTTPAPLEPGLSDAERWRKAGFTPDGKVIDPTHLQ